MFGIIYVTQKLILVQRKSVIWTLMWEEKNMKM